VIVATPDVDEKALNNFVEITVKQLNVEPINAQLSIKDGQVNEVKSQNGYMADTNNLADKIIDMVADGKSKIALDPIIKPAEIQSSEFEKAKLDAENYLSKTIIFTYNGQKYQPTRAEIGAWIVFSNVNGANIMSLDDSNIKAYLNKIAQKFEVSKIDTRVNADNGETIEKGRDGIYLNKDQTLSALKAQLGSDNVQLTLAVTTTPSNTIRVSFSQGVMLNRFQGKYIDVNLSTQVLCRVDGPTLLDCFQASAGKPSTPTPTGSYVIRRKNPMGWAPNPGVWMPWFMEFKAGGYGFHELVVWPDGTHEVIEHLGQAVSHGCVRTGPGVAEMLFNWADIGSTSVYIHK
jgi:lipoprotein-anchoring transpeptidase ErfK/SrfK